MSDKKRRTKPSTRLSDPDTVGGGKSDEMSKLRIGLIASDTSPRDIRDLLDDIGTVGEVSIHSDQDFTYALADMPYKDAEEAVQLLDNAPWRGGRISVEFANRVYSKGWLSGHDWKPPKRDRW